MSIENKAKENGEKEKFEINLATVCLNLFESVKDRTKEAAVTIICVPGDDAFERNILLKGYVGQALETWLSEIVFLFGAVNDEIMVSTEENDISVKGINIRPKDLEELCLEDGGKYRIAGNALGLAMAYLRLNGIYITIQNKNKAIIRFCN